MTAIDINLNCSSKKEHVTEIERSTRTVKDRIRSSQSTMPSKQVSKIMIVHLVASDIFWINAFPPSTSGAGLSDTKGPGQLVLGTMINFKKRFYLQPVEYVQVHQEDEPCNKFDINRTVSAIFLGPQYNLQGGYLFDILLTGNPPPGGHIGPLLI